MPPSASATTARSVIALLTAWRSYSNVAFLAADALLALCFGALSLGLFVTGVVLSVVVVGLGLLALWTRLVHSLAAADRAFTGWYTGHPIAPARAASVSGVGTESSSSWLSSARADFFTMETLLLGVYYNLVGYMWSLVSFGIVSLVVGGSVYFAVYPFMFAICGDDCRAGDDSDFLLGTLGGSILLALMSVGLFLPVGLFLAQQFVAGSYQVRRVFLGGSKPSGLEPAFTPVSPNDEERRLAQQPESPRDVQYPSMSVPANEPSPELYPRSRPAVGRQDSASSIVFQQVAAPAPNMRAVAASNRAHRFSQKYAAADEPPLVQDDVKIVKVVDQMVSNHGISYPQLLDRAGFSLLHHAAAQGHAHVIQSLLQQPGVNLNGRDAQGNTPLHVACAFVQTSVVTALLQSGQVDVNLANAFGETPLHLACGCGSMGGLGNIGSVSAPSTQVVQTLLAHKASVNIRSHDGESPLLRATLASQNDPQIVQILAMAGADMNARAGSQSNMTPLMAAAMHGYEAVVAALLESGGAASVNWTDASGWTALHWAASCNDVTNVVKLIGCGAAVNAASYQYETPLHLAARECHVESCKALVAAGADITLRDKQGQTPFARARLVGSHSAVLELLGGHAAAGSSSGTNQTF